MRPHLKVNKQNGFSTVAAISVTLAMFIVTAAIYEFMRRDVRLGAELEKSETALSCATMGTNETLGLIAANANLSDLAARCGNPVADSYGFYTINGATITDSNGRQIGAYKSKARLNKLTYLNNNFKVHYQIVTEGVPIIKKVQASQYRELMYTFAIIDDIGQFFLAVHNQDLTICAGADFRYADVYGYKVRFVDAGPSLLLSPSNPIRVRRVEYFDSVYPPPSDTAYTDGSILIDPTPEDGWTSPSQVTWSENEKRFPTLEKSDFDYYLAEAQKSSGSGVVIGNPFTNDVYPPYSKGNIPQSGTQSWVYYKTDGATSDLILGALTVHGQVVIVTPGKIVINGDIAKQSLDNIESKPTEFTTLRSADGKKQSKAHQLVLMAGKGFEIDGNYANDATKDLSVDGKTTKLLIQAYLIAPDSDIWVTEPASGSGATSAARSIKILGAMLLRQTPSLSESFQDTATTGGQPRVYQQDESLFQFPPPIRKKMKVIAQFHFSGYKNLSFAGAVGATPKWTYSYSPTTLPTTSPSP